MKTKFIKDTNKQYSITDSGEIIRNFKYRGRKEYGHKVEECTIMKYKKHPTRDILYVVVRSNGKTFNLFKNSLLAQYFNFIICPKCNNKIHTTKHIRVCDKCIKSNETEVKLKWRKENKDRVKELTKKSYDKNFHKYKDKIRNRGFKIRAEITRTYVASKLELKVSELSDELYDLYKIQLKTKRLLSNKTGVPTNLIK